MTVRKQGQSWLYDFTIPGYGRRRQRGFKTKAEALLAERAQREAVLGGKRQITLKDAYASYLAGSSMKARAKDAVERLWVPIERALGAMFIEDVGTSQMD